MGNNNKRKTTEQFKQEVFELVGDEYLVVNEYGNAKTKIRFVHNIENCMFEFDMQPSNFLSGQRCPECKKKENLIRIHNTRKTTEQFKKEVSDLVGDEYYVESDYINCHTKIKMKHSVCNYVFDITPSDFLRGRRCTTKECLHKRMGDNCSVAKGNNFLQQFKEYENEYEFLDPYSRRNKKIRFRHKICGCIFERTPNTFFNNINNVYNIKCPDCLKKVVPAIQPKSQKQFEKEVYDLYKEEYSVVGNYVNSNTKVKMRHNICGHIWDVQPNNFLGKGNQTGCPNCKTSKGERAIKTFLSNNNILTKTQKSFNNLVGIGGKLLSYDFYLPEYNLLIEYQGNFHDGTADIQTEKGFQIQQEHDRRKREYAKSHGIDLLEIWYWDFDNIENILTDYLNLHNKKAS